MDRISKLKEFLKTSPQDSFLIHALALEYVKISDLVAAEECFTLNLEKNPEYVATYYHLGKLYENAGKEAAAIKIYELGIIFSKQINDNHSFGELRAALDNLL
ncbi:hypothetical protein DBR32_13605 [Taibaiella sp. KBW10]|uniref:hypothetical protein n=1 Tax=Taibaiella sp. KBW10 TaxID=2153357 RepID=UPI000F5A8363|nr:hypothetical protein [Taibaiella sp. KBW10]RQO29947.1 hypothetical protein DBR32_13605 [Taibaiella sp. KBW10]